MNIGIDIDGVLTELTLYMDREGEKYFGKPVEDSSALNIGKRFGFSENREDEFWDDKYYDYIINCDFKPGAKETIAKLREDGNKIHIVTARHFEPQYGFTSPEDMTRKTLDSLQRNGIEYDEYVEAKPPKVSETRERGIDIFIDDEEGNIRELAKVTKVIIFDNPYNRHLNLENTYRARSWKEVYEIISSLKA